MESFVDYIGQERLGNIPNYFEEPKLTILSSQ